MKDVLTKPMRVSIIYFFIILLTLIVRIGFAVSPPPAEKSDAVFTVIIQILLFGIVPLAAYSLFVLKKDRGGKMLKSLFSDFGFTRGFNLKTLLITIAVGILMMFTATFISVVWNAALVLMGFTPIRSSTDYNSIGVLFKELALTALLPALFEETCHRGLLFAGYKDEGESPRFIIVISALLFALMHQNIRQTGYTFYDGIILGFLCFYTRSIWAPILVHFMNNAGAVISGYVEQNGGYVYVYVNQMYDFLLDSLLGLLIFFVLFVAAVALLVLLLKELKKEYYKEIYRPESERKKRLNKRGTKAGEEKNTKTPAQPQAVLDIDRFYTAEEFKTEYAEENTYALVDRHGLLKRRLKDNCFTYITIAVGIAATIFTLIWGFFR